LKQAGGDVATWARAHEAGFEVAPLMEIVKGRQVQLGFEIGLYARLPLDKGPGAERRAEAAKIAEALREIVRTLVPAKGSRARVELEAPRSAVVLEPEGGREPEVAVRARVFHADDYFEEATADEEEKLRAVVQRLAQMGLKERRRRIR